MKILTTFPRLLGWIAFGGFSDVGKLSDVTIHGRIPMSDKKVRATLTLLPTIDGGLKSTVPNGSPSLLFTFLSDEQEVQVGGPLHIEGRSCGAWRDRIGHA